jgi:hypothetical protein
MRQSVSRDGGFQREEFLNDTIIDDVINSIFRLCERLNINAISMYHTFLVRISGRPITLYPDRESHHAVIHVEIPSGSIGVYGDNDAMIGEMTFHEFLHALCEGHYSFRRIRSYNEGLTELLTIIGSADSHNTEHMEAYPESTLLTAAVGIFHDMSRRARGGQPQAWGTLIEMPSIETLVQAGHGIDIDGNDSAQRVFLYPQTDEGSSVRELRGLLGLTRRHAWRNFKAELIEGIIEDARLEPESQAAIDLRNHFRELWSDL